MKFISRKQNHTSKAASASILNKRNLVGQENLRHNLSDLTLRSHCHSSAATVYVQERRNK
jgi:hypothetical protein